MIKRTLLKNGTVITMGERSLVLKNHSLSFNDDGIIEAIAPSENFNEANFNQVIDAKNKLIMPGFINAHMHFYSSFARGLSKAAPSKNFTQVLENLWWKLDKLLTLDDVYYSTLTASIDAIKKGTTTLLDHHASPSAVTGSLHRIKEAMHNAGLRGSLCYELSDRDGDKIAKEGILENISFINECHDACDDQFIGHFGMHASFTLSDKTMRDAVLAAKDYNVGFHIHAAEDLADQHETMKKHGKRVIERLHKQGILGPKTICGHAIHINDEEIELLAKTDTIVVHNPQSNMNNAVGMANIFKLLEKGILVGLGTDAMTVNMIEELRACMWAHKLASRDPSVGFMEVTSLLAQHNRRIIQRFWPKVGELREGMYADVILMDYDSPTTLDESNFLGHLVFGLSNGVVDTTIVKGKVLMQGKVLTQIDEHDIMAKARVCADALWKRF